MFSGLETLGWRSFFTEHFRPFGDAGRIPARVAIAHRSEYRLYTTRGEVDGELAGRLRHLARGRQSVPAVGDWVAITALTAERRTTIHAVLPRLTSFSRKVSGDATEEQVVAANVDTVLLVSGLDGDFNPRRIERYLVLAWESGAVPVVVLTKADLCPTVEEHVARVAAIAPSVPIHVVSSPRNAGLADVARYLAPGQTVAVLGSSGVGKSTLINRLIGREVLKTGDVRAGDGHGRHTTTHRELLLLPSGGLIMDTPGMRELQLWEANDGHQNAFDDVLTLAERCHFQDCSHRCEPRCAVGEAIAGGHLSDERFESYAKLERELRHLKARGDKRAQRTQKRRDKVIHRLMRHHRPRT